MEGPSAPDRTLAAHVHRRDLGEDQHGAPARLGTRGRRLKAYAPHGHWKTLTFIAALRHDRIDAPWVIDGPINGETFLLYIEKILAPTLSPGDVVVLDNLLSHKGGSGEAVRRASVRLGCPFAPPHPFASLRITSLMLSPIRRRTLRLFAVASSSHTR
jgi:hypothetical protein